MKGILLAGGSGTRLAPLTSYISKQLLMVYNKPMIYYPLSILMLAGIKDILIISTPRDLKLIENHLGNGHNLGINLSYAIQDKPNGIPESFLIGEKFIGDSNVCLILGDNLFYGDGLHAVLKAATQMQSGACILAHHVVNPSAFGVIEFDKKMRAISIEEKPLNPKSSWAVTGLYFYNNDVVGISKQLNPSQRGELEITDVNKVYLERGDLKVHLLKRGTTWLDMGTFDNLLKASNLIATIETMQNLKIGCLEEISYNMGFISSQQMKKLAEAQENLQLKQYLINILEQTL